MKKIAIRIGRGIELYFNTNTGQYELPELQESDEVIQIVSTKPYIGKDREIRVYYICKGTGGVSIEDVLDIIRNRIEDKSNDLEVIEKVAEYRKRVEAIVLDDKNRILGGINPRHGFWTIPGGGIEDDEDILSAAKRELAEETGIKADPIKILNPDNPIINDKKGSMTYLVLARPKKGKTSNQLGADNDIIQNLGYYTIDDMGYKADPSYLSKRLDILEKEFGAIPKSASIKEPPEFEIEPEDIECIRYIEEKRGEYIEKEGAITTTVGQAIVNGELPNDLRDYGKQLDKKAIKKVLKSLALKYPDKYRDVLKNLIELGDNESLFGDIQLKYSNISSPIDSTPYFEKAKIDFERNKKVLKNETIALIDTYSKAKETLTKDTIAAGMKDNNSLAIMAASGTRGSPGQFTDVTEGPVLVSDFKNRPIPIVLDRGYAQGLTPAQYFAASYGSRRGVISSKLAVPLSGYMSKMLGWTTADIVVTEDDCGIATGNVYDIDDKWNIGKYLAHQTGKYPRNTLITDDVIQDLRKQGLKDLCIRSPISCSAKLGVCAKCLGKTEVGTAPIGYAAGINASAALSEPLTQSSLSEKHTGGALKKRIGGFPLIQQLVKVPESFQNAATLAQVHGRVDDIKSLDWGGWEIDINGNKHFTNQDNPPIVNKGDKVEKGDILSEGLPNPAKVTELKGWGEGRKSLSNSLRSAFDDMGANLDRVHYEVTSRGLINFGEALAPIGSYLPNEIGKLDDMKRDIKYKDAQLENIKDISPFTKYLSQQVLYYTPGTEITEKVLDNIKKQGYTKIWTTAEPTPIQPLMVRVEDTLKYDKDWVYRLASQGLKKSLTDGVQRGDYSPYHGIKYVHPLILGQEFGKKDIY